MISEIRTALESLGYTVHSTRQEKIKSGEFVVIVDDVDIRIETNQEYRVYVWILIEWDTMSPDDIPTDIVTLLRNLEQAIYTDQSVSCCATFKFIQSEVNQLGLMYRVSVVVEYVDLIDL